MDKIEEALSYKKSLHLYITGAYTRCIQSNSRV
jgi:hypothetical protein